MKLGFNLVHPILLYLVTKFWKSKKTTIMLDCSKNVVGGGCSAIWLVIGPYISGKPKIGCPAPFRLIKEKNDFLPKRIIFGTNCNLIFIV